MFAGILIGLTLGVPFGYVLYALISVNRLENERVAEYEKKDG